MPELNPVQFINVASAIAPDMRKIWEIARPKLLEQIDAQLEDWSGDTVVAAAEFCRSVGRLTQLNNFVTIEQLAKRTSFPVDLILGWIDGKKMPEGESANDQLVTLYKALRALVANMQTIEIRLQV